MGLGRQAERVPIDRIDSLTSRRSITIRLAGSADARALRRLAEVDSAALPPDDFLVAEVGGEPLAALALGSGTVLANPFHPTAELTDLLRVRAERLRAAAAGCGPSPSRSRSPWRRGVRTLAGRGARAG